MCVLIRCFISEQSGDKQAHLLHLLNSQWPREAALQVMWYFLSRVLTVVKYYRRVDCSDSITTSTIDNQDKTIRVSSSPPYSESPFHTWYSWTLSPQCATTCVHVDMMSTWISFRRCHSGTDTLLYAKPRVHVKSFYSDIACCIWNKYSEIGQNNILCIISMKTMTEHSSSLL